MENSRSLAAASRTRALLLLLLAGNLAFKLLLYLNTNSFFVSEAGSNFNFLRAIERGLRPALFEGGFRSTLAYIGYFIKSLSGSLAAFFWFQALLGVFSLYILYRLCLRAGVDSPAALFSLLLASVSMDYHLLTPVFYYQAFEIFFVLLSAWLLLVMIDGKKMPGWAAAFLVPFLVYVSILFRGTLSYFSWLLIAMALVTLLRREFAASARLAGAAILTVALFALLPQGNFKNKSIQSVNDFKFFGHTLYGGDGGEGTFIYKENEARYKKKLAAFMKERGYERMTVKIHNEFQSREIREFMSRTPHKWLWLQARKIAYTFGIVPIRDSLELLSGGKVPLDWKLGAAIVQLPYVFILLVFIALLVLFFAPADLADTKVLFMFLLLLYLVASTCLYGHYQERYRQVVIIAGMLPLAAHYFGKFRRRSAAQPVKRGRFILLALVLALLFAHWGYQAYDVLVVHKDRYAAAVRQFKALP